MYSQADIKELSTTRLSLIQTPLWSRVTERARREDPLPYSMNMLGVTEKACPLCGPPFTVIPLAQLLDMSVCSFECAKRYVIEVYAHPFGYNLTHGKVVRDEGTVGRESFLFYTTKTNLYCIDVTYRKLQLLCEHARVPKATHQEQVVPEGHRQGKSKRCNCKFRVTISWPVRPMVGPDGNIRPDLPYISSLRTSHNHDLHPDFDTR